MRLQRSLSLLHKTNATLLSSISPSSVPGSPAESLSDEEKSEYQEIIAENEDAIATQEERVDMCKFALAKKLGIDPGNKHYDLDTSSTAITVRREDESSHGGSGLLGAAPASQEHRAGQSGQAGIQEDAEGFYL